MYAVIDVETTGILPKLRHRIAEIAVVLVDESGRSEHEWSTLINPERDLGPQHIHQIKARDVIQAPRFIDVAAHLIELLSGRVIVAHNLAFEIGFLTAEFDRMKVSTPLAHDLGLCTMMMSASFLPGAGRNLNECCRAADIPLFGWHSALADATATARLLSHYIEVAAHPAPWNDVVQQARKTRWPFVDRRDFTVKTRPPNQTTDFRGVIAQSIDFMPRVDSTELADPYLAVLDQAICDRYLSIDETAALSTLADSLSLTSKHVVDLHTEYVNALARVAMADGVLTEAETADVEHVATMLGLPGDVAARALTAATRTNPSIKELPIEPGDMIVFTGQMAEPREVWWERATQHGFIPHSGVTKKVKLVVAADTDSLSGKAKKARGYDIPIMSVEQFRIALGYGD